jgi:hypothetical protein
MNWTDQVHNVQTPSKRMIACDIRAGSYLHSERENSNEEYTAIVDGRNCGDTQAIQTEYYDVSLVDKQAHSTRWLGYGSICARVEMTSLADVNVDEAAQPDRRSAARHPEWYATHYEITFQNSTDLGRGARPLQRLVRRARRWWFCLPVIVAMSLCTLTTSQTMRAAAVPG